MNMFLGVTQKGEKLMVPLGVVFLKGKGYY